MSTGRGQQSSDSEFSSVNWKQKDQFFKTLDEFEDAIDSRSF